jgi:hypothetical protein
LTMEADDAGISAAEVVTRIIAAVRCP